MATYLYLMALRRGLTAINLKVATFRISNKKIKRHVKTLCRAFLKSTSSYQALEPTVKTKSGKNPKSRSHRVLSDSCRAGSLEHYLWPKTLTQAHNVFANRTGVGFSFTQLVTWQHQKEMSFS